MQRDGEVCGYEGHGFKGGISFADSTVFGQLTSDEGIVLNIGIYTSLHTLQTLFPSSGVDHRMGILDDVLGLIRTNIDTLGFDEIVKSAQELKWKEMDGDDIMDCLDEGWYENEVTRHAAECILRSHRPCVIAPFITFKLPSCMS